MYESTGRDTCVLNAVAESWFGNLAIQQLQDYKTVPERQVPRAVNIGEYYFYVN